MKALLDTNIFVSYLLGADARSPISIIVEAGVTGKFTMLLPEELMDELQKTLLKKSFLAASIPPRQLDEFLTILSDASEILPTLTEEIPLATRDPKDNYLFAYAVAYNADALVSGDKDLLSLKNLARKKLRLHIYSPREFLQFL